MTRCWRDLAIDVAVAVSMMAVVVVEFAAGFGYVVWLAGIPV
jgi:hypothetical protein